MRYNSLCSAFTNPMDDWQCRDKSVRYLWRVLCEIIFFSSIGHQFQDKLWSHFEASPSNLQQGGSVFVIVYAQLRVCRRQGKNSPAEASLPKKTTPPFPPCILPPKPPACPSPVPAPPSLNSLLVGCAAWVLGLHDVRELWGSGEGLDPQLLERIIWDNDRERERETAETERCEDNYPKGNWAEEIWVTRQMWLKRAKTANGRVWRWLLWRSYRSDEKLIPLWQGPEVELFDLWNHNFQEFVGR